MAIPNATSAPQTQIKPIPDLTARVNYLTAQAFGQGTRPKRVLLGQSEQAEFAQLIKKQARWVVAASPNEPERLCDLLVDRCNAPSFLAVGAWVSQSNGQ